MRRFDEVDRVIAMLLQTGRDGENVRIEDDVVRRKSGPLCQKFVSARADLDLALQIVGLTPLIERHHDDGRSVAPDQLCLAQKFFFAVFQADRIHDRFSLHAFESGLDHAPLRAVDHDRNPCDLWLACDQVQEARHRRFGIDHSLVHIDVEHVGAALDLLPRHRQRAVEIVAQNQFRKFRRARDVGPLANHSKAELRRNVQRFEPRKLQSFGLRIMPVRLGPRFAIAHGGHNRANVFRRCPAATADQIEPAVFGPAF